jgi:hypothetical protein
LSFFSFVAKVRFVDEKKEFEEIVLSFDEYLFNETNEYGFDLLLFSLIFGIHEC